MPAIKKETSKVKVEKEKDNSNVVVDIKFKAGQKFATPSPGNGGSLFPK